MSDALINGLAGAAGGIIAQLITYPLQTVNTRQQTERVNAQEKTKVGVMEQMYQVVRHEGWERLYGGLTPSLLGTAASQGVYYYFYQIFRSRAEVAAAAEHARVGVGDGSVGMLSSLAVAALSGCLNVLLTNPIWVIVTRMQTYTRGITLSATDEEQGPPHPPPPTYGTFHAIEELYTEAGAMGFWKGVFPTLVMVSNPSIQFMLYETMVKEVKKNKKNAVAVSALQIFVLSALAKLAATIVTYPLLVVKSRLQAKQAAAAADNAGGHDHYRGTFDAVAKIVRHEGLPGFYRGMSTKIVQSVLAAAILFSAKEELLRSITFFLNNRCHLPLRRISSS